MKQTFEPISETDEPPTRHISWLQLKWYAVKHAIRSTKWKRALAKAAVIVALLALFVGYCVYRYSVWNNTWSFHFQSPIVLHIGNPSTLLFQNFTRIDPRITKLKPLIKTAKAAEIPEPPTFDDKIREAFGKHANTFLQIAHAESGQNAGAKGFNCRYNGVSQACKPGDQENAWSVDCGALQVNVYGTKCPVELYDLDLNLQAAKGKFERQGFNAWSVCKFKKVVCK